MADTTTTLNAGSGGDVMDESLVTQTSGTQAKRPRVVTGGDDGSLQTYVTRPENVAAVVSDPKADSGNDLVLSELKKISALLGMLLIQVGGEAPNEGYERNSGD